MVIREMQAQDVEAVTALEAACFTQPWKRHDFEDILTNPDRFYFVADKTEYHKTCTNHKRYILPILT